MRFCSTLLGKWKGVLELSYSIIYGSETVFLNTSHPGYQKYSLSPNQDLAFVTYIAKEGFDMLTKRSTPADQNLKSESIDSKLSVAIFVALRTQLATQECCVYEKKSKNY